MKKSAGREENHGTGLRIENRELRVKGFAAQKFGKGRRIANMQVNVFRDTKSFGECGDGGASTFAG
jgi:hypothetical protein